MTAHAKLSASGSAKWLNCPGSVNAEEPYPNTSSSFADEGTMAHELADMCLKKRVDADSFVGKKIKKTVDGRKLEIVVTKEMALNVQEYIDYVYAHETKDSILFTEEKVDFSNIVPEGFGTLDSGILIPKIKTLHIFDLKYGKGVMVNAFENTQGQLYGIGFLNDWSWLYDIETIVIHICQPRKENFSSWEISVKDLNTFSKFVTERAELALTKNAPRIPGEKQCQWCAAKNDCKALANFTEEVIKCQFDNLNDVEALDKNVLTDADKKVIIDNKKLIINFIESVAASVYDEMCEGSSFPGYKLVEGRSNRVWGENAEEALVEKLGDEAYNKKLIGITEAQKHIGKKDVDALAIKPKGKLTMVPEYDKRKAVLVEDISLYFGNLDEEKEDDGE